MARCYRSTRSLLAPHGTLYVRCVQRARAVHVPYDNHTLHAHCLPTACPLQVYSLRSVALLRAAARARWAALLAAWRLARGGGLHLGEKKIRRAARRLYATQLTIYRTHGAVSGCPV